MELTIRVGSSHPILSREAADIAMKMSRFESQVLIRKKDLTVNAKSLIGIMSLGLTSGQAVTILTEGKDEAEAACELSQLLGA